MNLGQEEGMPQLQVDPTSLDWAGCEGEAQMYEPAVLFKRLPALMSPSGKEEYLPMDVILCKKCGKVPEFVYSQVPDFPEQFKSTCNAKKSSGLQI